MNLHSVLIDQIGVQRSLSRYQYSLVPYKLVFLEKWIISDAGIFTAKEITKTAFTEKNTLVGTGAKLKLTLILTLVTKLAS